MLPVKKAIPDDQSSSRRPVTPEEYRLIYNARTILESNLEEPPRLPDLACSVGVSLSRLKELFTRVCGIPPYGYLRRMRMEKALYLLQQTDLPVTQIAYEVGYASPSQFARAFGDQFGLSPSQARKENQKKVIFGFSG